MTLRSGHGAGAGVPRIEVLRATELPRGRPGPATLPEDRRDARGRFTSGNRTSRQGGIARARTSAFAQRLGLAPVDPSFAPYLRAASAFRRVQIARLAQTVGGGEVGPGPCAIIASAALQLAGSRRAFDQGDVALGSKLANDSRQNLLAAFELCAKEAQAKPAPDMAAWWAQFTQPQADEHADRDQHVDDVADDADDDDLAPDTESEAES